MIPLKTFIFMMGICMTALYLFGCAKKPPHTPMKVDAFQVCIDTYGGSDEVFEMCNRRHPE